VDFSKSSLGGSNFAIDSAVIRKFSTIPTATVVAGQTISAFTENLQDEFLALCHVKTNNPSIIYFQELQSWIAGSSGFSRYNQLDRY
jgi:hypothetical protein